MTLDSIRINRLFMVFILYGLFLVSIQVGDEFFDLGKYWEGAFNLIGCVFFLSLFIFICRHQIRFNRITFIFGILLFLVFMWFVFDFTEEVPELRSVPVFGEDSRVRRFLETVILIGILWVYLLGVYLSLIEINDYRDQLVGETAKLKAVEEALKQESNFTRQVIESAAEGMCVNHRVEGSPHARFTLWNRRMEEITGYTLEEINELGWTPTMYPEPEYQKKAFDRLEAMRNGDHLCAEEWTITRSNGEKRVISISTTTLYMDGLEPHVLAVMTDVTDKKQLESQLAQAQKMEAIGTLAGGIAHDFNNILMGIMGYTDIVASRLPKGGDLWNYQQCVIQAAIRAKELVQQILSFSRQSDETRRPMNVVPLIRESLKLLRSTIPANIEIHEDVSPQCGLVNANPTLIHQIVMNLCTNAYQAMRDQNGVLSVSVRPRIVDKPMRTVEGTFAAPGDYLMIEVRDTGVGMRPDIQEKIFEPYFTTKRAGEGTGLGLAVVHGVVSGMEGFITLESKVGEGSAFGVYLPENKVDDTALDALFDDTPPVGDERVMVIDDEESLVNLMNAMLTELGYQAFPFNDPQEAMRRFFDDPSFYDLVIVDMTLPRLTGERLAAQFWSVRPELPVVLCTGYNETINEDRAKSIGFRAFLTKPFTKADLARVVRRALDDEPSI
ncbi:MAG: response regulator [bacterium]|nr:response regulator [bacterium]